MKLFLLLFFGCVPLYLIAENSSSSDLAKTITYLLDYVEKSNAVMIRNGSEHTGKEAAAHLKTKYEHFKKEIKTPEDFIRLSATKSMVSGKPYLVRLAGGKEITCADWLTTALKDYRESKPTQ